ncbi:MAG: GTP cyclohydrolase I [bacterium]
MAQLDLAGLQLVAENLLILLGEDPNREGLRETPRRIAHWYDEFINYDPGNTEVTFEAVTTDQLVVVTGIRVYSLCEHHMLPFWADISMGYLAANRVLGLSKFARIAHKHAHRLQIQERLVSDIADEICALAQTESVAVLARGFHLCMAMRGVRTPATMTTSALRGMFRADADLRHEFLSLCQLNNEVRP